METGTALAEETATETAASAWEDPPRRMPVTTAPVLSVEGFEGPLDWLLEMARAQKINLARLSILALVDSFVAAMAAFAMQEATPMSLARRGDWLVMATTLVQLRSRLLLPPDAPTAKLAHSEGEALRRRLLDCALMAAAADWLERQPRLGRDVFARGSPEIAASPGRIIDITELLRACLVVLRVLPAQFAAYRPRPLPFWSVADAIARIGRLSPELPDGVQLASFLPEVTDEVPDRERHCRAALASTLIAGLELARGGDLTLHQDEPWMPIRVERREPMGADDSTASQSR